MVAKAGRRKTGGTAVAREDVCTNALRRREALVQCILAAMMCLCGRNSPLSEMRADDAILLLENARSQVRPGFQCSLGTEKLGRRSGRG